MSRLDEIEGRLKAATPGPWEVNNAHGLCVLGPDPHGPCVADMEGAAWQGKCADATLIASAPADLAHLLRVARAAERLLSETFPCSVCRETEPCCEECQAERDLRQALEEATDEHA